LCDTIRNNPIVIARCRATLGGIIKFVFHVKTLIGCWNETKILYKIWSDVANFVGQRKLKSFNFCHLSDFLLSDLILVFRVNSHLPLQMYIMSHRLNIYILFRKTLEPNFIFHDFYSMLVTMFLELRHSLKSF
jgi:hypothetical protein